MKDKFFYVFFTSIFLIVTFLIGYSLYSKIEEAELQILEAEEIKSEDEKKIIDKKVYARVTDKEYISPALIVKYNIRRREQFLVTVEYENIEQTFNAEELYKHLEVGNEIEIILRTTYENEKIWQQELVLP